MNRLLAVDKPPTCAGEWLMPPGEILNPSAVGNPDETPILRASPGLIALLRPCRQIAHDGTCGGVNGYHAEGCPLDTEACTCEHYVPEWGPHDSICPMRTSK